MSVVNGQKSDRTHRFDVNAALLAGKHREAGSSDPEYSPLPRLMLAAPLGLAVLGSALTVHLIFSSRAKRHLGF